MRRFAWGARVIAVAALLLSDTSTFAAPASQPSVAEDVDPSQLLTFKYTEEVKLGDEPPTARQGTVWRGKAGFAVDVTGNVGPIGSRILAYTSWSRAGQWEEGIQTGSEVLAPRVTRTPEHTALRMHLEHVARLVPDPLMVAIGDGKRSLADIKRGYPAYDREETVTPDGHRELAFYHANTVERKDPWLTVRRLGGADAVVDEVTGRWMDGTISRRLSVSKWNAISKGELRYLYAEEWVDEEFEKTEPGEATKMRTSRHVKITDVGLMDATALAEVDLATLFGGVPVGAWIKREAADGSSQLLKQNGPAGLKLLSDSPAPAPSVAIASAATANVATAIVPPAAPKAESGPLLPVAAIALSGILLILIAPLVLYSLWRGRARHRAAAPTGNR